MRTPSPLTAHLSVALTAGVVLLAAGSLAPTAQADVRNAWDHAATADRIAPRGMPGSEGLGEYFGRYRKTRSIDAAHTLMTPSPGRPDHRVMQASGHARSGPVSWNNQLWSPAQVPGPIGSMPDSARRPISETSLVFIDGSMNDSITQSVLVNRVSILGAEFRSAAYNSTAPSPGTLGALALAGLAIARRRRPH